MAPVLTSGTLVLTSASGAPDLTRSLPNSTCSYTANLLQGSLLAYLLRKLGKADSITVFVPTADSGPSAAYSFATEEGILAKTFRLHS